MATGPSPELLATILGSTLEEAAFVFAEVAERPPPFPGDVIEARLAYSGSHDGELLLAASPELAATLAANLLGEEEGGAGVTGDDFDAMGELLNMLAGTLAVEMFGPDQRCKLGLPRVERVTAERHLASLSAASAAAVLQEEEGRRIDLSVTTASGNVP